MMPMKYKKELKKAFKDVDFMEAVHEARKESTLRLLHVSTQEIEHVT